MKTRTFGQYTLEIEQGAVHLHYSRSNRFWMDLGYLGAIGLFFIVTTFLLREYGLQNGFSFPVALGCLFFVGMGIKNLYEVVFRLDSPTQNLLFIDKVDKKRNQDSSYQHSKHRQVLRSLFCWKIKLIS